MDNESLADVIAEIFDGVTVLSSSFGPIYVRHFGQIELRRTFSKKTEYLEDAKNRGLMTEKECLALLYKDEMWSEENEKRHQSQKDLVSNLNKSLNKIKIPSKRELHKKMIYAESAKISEFEKEKEALLGLTAEKYAQTKVNQDFFENLLFSDKNFEYSVFENLEYSNLNKEKEINKLQEDFFQRMSDENISKAALSPFYSPYLSYSEDVYGMFGNPIKELTAFELKLITYARTFLNIFKNSQKEIPSHIARDPELLMDFYDAQKEQANNKKDGGSSGDGGTTYFGANKEDIDAMKSEDQDAVDLQQEMKKRGGSLNMKEFMELHGV